MSAKSSFMKTAPNHSLGAYKCRKSQAGAESLEALIAGVTQISACLLQDPVDATANLRP